MACRYDPAAARRRDRQAVASPATLIEQVQIFDGRRLLGTGSVLITGDQISQVGRQIPRHPTWRIVDGRGQTLLPGLIDAHTHTSSTRHLAQALASGVTTVLDMFSFPPDLTSTLRIAAANRDDLADFRGAGILASAPGGFPGAALPSLPTLSSPAEADAFVAARQAEASDYIKIFVDNGAATGRPALSPDTVAALVRAARDRNLLTVAHAPSRWAAQVALDAGVHVLTHVPLDTALDRTFAARAAAGGLVVIPTLTMMRVLSRPCRPPGPTTGNTSYDAARASTAALHAAGLPILAGTDANDGTAGPPAIPHGESLHHELALLVEAGLSPVEALTAATSATAHHFGLADRGRIAPGQRADLLLVAGDPTTTITATRSITRTWRRGTPYPSARAGRLPA